MDLQNLGQSKQFKWLLLGLGMLIILLLVFQLGMFVGFRKASFSYGWGDNYHRNFGGPRGGFLRDFVGKDFINSHGTTGTVAKVDGNTVIIKDQDGKEKSVIVSGNATVRKGAEAITVADLKVDERIVVIGTPEDDSSITAEIIRVFYPNQPVVPSRGFRTPWFRQLHEKIINHNQSA